MDVLLLHPPAVKPAEPPLGAAVLLAHLRLCGFSATALDANLAAYLYLLDPRRLEQAAGPQPATAVRRALRHASSSLALLRSPLALASFARYSTAIRHLNTALSVWGDGGGERLTLGDYERDDLSPFAPGDLERLATGAATSLFTRYFEEDLLPRVEALQPRLIALSINYRHQVLPAFELAGLLRRRLPQVPVIGGGGIFTSWRTMLRRLDLRFPPFSRIVFGPGEEPLAALAAGEALAGDYFLQGTATVGFLPDYDFARLADYLSPVPVLPVSASRGCYWQRCLFCPEAAAPTHPYAALQPTSFAELLRELAERYGARHFHFTDNALPVAVLRQLAAVGPALPGLSWHGFVRFEKALLDPELVAGLAESGCAMLQLGLESGSQAVLDRLQKGTRLEDVAAILANLKRVGIASYVYVMLGTPGESEADAEQTLHFLEEHAEAIGFLNLAIMNLPRESGLLADPAAGIADSGLLGEDEPLGLYRSFAPTTGWGRREARRFLDRRLLASPAIRAILQRTPPLFTSNHAFLLSPPST
jgi:hypothetical protein